jgi:hypothetical protein
MSRGTVRDEGESHEQLSEIEMMAVLEDDEAVLGMIQELRLLQRDFRQFAQEYVRDCESVAEQISKVRRARKTLNGKEGGNGHTA